MKNDNFNTHIRNLINSHEETVDGGYDRDRIWKNTYKSKAKKRWIVSVSVTAVSLLVLSFFINSVTLIPIKNEKVVDYKGKNYNKSQVLKNESRILIDIKTTPISTINREEKNTPLAESNDIITGFEPEIMSQQTADSIIPVDNIVVNPAPFVKVESDEVIKLTFKRGVKKDETVAGIKVKLFIGFKPLNTKETQIPDTTYYVNIPNPFKLIFKN